MKTARQYAELAEMYVSDTDEARKNDDPTAAAAFAGIAQAYATLAAAAAQVADTEAAFGKVEELVKTADSLAALYRNHACPPADYPAEP